MIRVFDCVWWKHFLWFLHTSFFVWFYAPMQMVEKSSPKHFFHKTSLLYYIIQVKEEVLDGNRKRNLNNKKLNQLKKARTRLERSKIINNYNKITWILAGPHGINSASFLSLILWRLLCTWKYKQIHNYCSTDNSF